MMKKRSNQGGEMKKATIEDLYEIDGKAELIEGIIVMDSPTGMLPNYAAGEIFVRLRDYAREYGTGHAISDNAAFIVNLPNRQSFSPDAAYHLGPLTMKFAEGFAVEVRSENDRGPAAEGRLATKRADYFAAGTLVVWDVDLEAEDIVRVHRKDQTEPERFSLNDLANAEPAVPGWSMPVADLFPNEPARG